MLLKLLDLILQISCFILLCLRTIPILLLKCSNSFSKLSDLECYLCWCVGINKRKLLNLKRVFKNCRFAPHMWVLMLRKSDLGVSSLRTIIIDRLRWLLLFSSWGTACTLLVKYYHSVRGCWVHSFSRNLNLGHRWRIKYSSNRRLIIWGEIRWHSHTL